MTYPSTISEGDHQAHRELAHDRHVAHLEAAINEATAALGWLQAWPNQITNGEEELETVITVLRVALRRAGPDEVGDNHARHPDRPTISFDERGDVRGNSL